MAEQQYSVISDRDKGDNPKVHDAEPGDLLIHRSTRADALGALVRIERPVPTTDDPDEFGSDELATAYIAWRDRGAGRDYERVPVAFEAGWDAHTASVSTSLPTREQIAEALWREENAAPTDVVTGKPWLRSSYFNQAAAVLALIQNGADR